MYASSGLIFWDLDGTLVDSVPLKGELFAEVFDDYSEYHDALVAFHHQHGGLNRSEKIRRMGAEVLQIALDDDQIARRSARFAELIDSRVREAPLAPGALTTLQDLAATYPMHVVTAMPDAEALPILRYHRIADYFETTTGFPVPKSKAVKSTLSAHDPRPSAVLIGDSSEDASTAIQSGIGFIQVRLGTAAPLLGAVLILDGLEGAARRIRETIAAL